MKKYILVITMIFSSFAYSMDKKGEGDEYNDIDLMYQRIKDSVASENFEEAANWARRFIIRRTLGGYSMRISGMFIEALKFSPEVLSKIQQSENMPLIADWVREGFENRRFKPDDDESYEKYIKNTAVLFQE